MARVRLFDRGLSSSFLVHNSPPFPQPVHQKLFWHTNSLASSVHLANVAKLTGAQDMIGPVRLTLHARRAGRVEPPTQLLADLGTGLRRGGWEVWLGRVGTVAREEEVAGVAVVVTVV